MTSPYSRETTVERLADQVRELRIEHRALCNEVAAIRRNLQVRSDTAVSEENQRPTSKPEKPAFSIGERVIVKNPGRGRINTGVVTGITVAGFVRVKLSTGETLRRLPKNLVKLK